MSYEAKKDNWFLKSEPLLTTMSPHDLRFGNEEEPLKTDFDEMFKMSKARAVCSVSPKSSNLKSVSSPYCSPGGETSVLHNQSTQSKSNVRDSRIDLLFDLENYSGPTLAVSKDLVINEYCINHPEKKSKFYITNNIFSKEVSSSRMNRGFCSKCSVQIAMKGFNMQEVLSEDEFKRKDRIENFLEMLNGLKKSDLVRLNKAQNAADSLAKQYRQKQGVIEETFNQLIEFIRQKKQATLKRFSMMTEGVMAQMEELTSTVKLKLETVAAMKNDIESNLDKIITKIDIAPFNQIIMNYESNLASLDSQITEKALIQKVDLIAKPRIEVERKIYPLLEELFSYKKDSMNLLGRDFDLKKTEKEQLEQVPETNSLSHEEDLTHSTRSLGPLQSLQGISRTTNIKEDQPIDKNYAFNYQFYKRMSTEVDRTKVTTPSETDFRPDSKRRHKQKDLATLSFDHRVIVSRQKQAEEIEK